MRTIQNILFPVDFSPSGAAVAAKFDVLAGGPLKPGFGLSGDVHISQT
jgi:hypothetical protein